MLEGLLHEKADILSIVLKALAVTVKIEMERM
jgi:hypothetical protein